MPKILCIGKVWPEPLSSAAGARMMYLLNLFHQHGWEVIFASVSRESDFSATAADLPFASAAIQLNDPSFDEFIKMQDPDVVLFDRFTSEEQFGWRVAEHCPRALKILDTEDLHGLREARRIALQENRSLIKSDLLNDICKREVASIYRSDLSLIISEYEMNLLTQDLKVNGELLFYLPFYSERVNSEARTRLPSFDERAHFISIGNFLHAPNADAVRYLEKKIWPRIRERLPKAELHVYGAYHENYSSSSNTKDGFILKGRAQDSKTEMMKHRICLAPLRFGAGLKGKLLEAMQCGTPAVTTSVGAEGMHGDLSFNGFIEDDPEKFVAAAVELYQHQQLWKTSQENGFDIVRTVFNNNHHQMLLERIDDLLQNLDAHRSANFTGAMLMHHSMQSTRYLSKWIEEKSRRSQKTE